MALSAISCGVQSTVVVDNEPWGMYLARNMSAIVVWYEVSYE